MTAGEAERTLAGGTSAVRWRRFGHDRLYVTASDGARLGYRDLATGTDHPDLPEHAANLATVADEWRRPRSEAPSVAADQAPAQPPTETQRPWIDLSLNKPAEAVRALAQATYSEAPVRHAVARLIGVKNDERAWRIGADGEELVGEQLAKLARQDPWWTAIHNITVGSRGSDIDHLIIGPGGVFTVNTKCHPDATVWVGGNSFLVNGHRTQYVRNSRHEAERATRLLSAAAGFTVQVEALIVPVRCSVTIKAQPQGGVHVVGRRHLVDWLKRLGPVLDSEQLSTVWEYARRSTTWEG